MPPKCFPQMVQQSINPGTKSTPELRRRLLEPRGIILDLRGSISDFKVLIFGYLRGIIWARFGSATVFEQNQQNLLLHVGFVLPIAYKYECIFAIPPCASHSIFTESAFLAMPLCASVHEEHCPPSWRTNTHESEYIHK